MLSVCSLPLLEIPDIILYLPFFLIFSISHSPSFFPCTIFPLSSAFFSNLSGPTQEKMVPIVGQAMSVLIGCLKDPTPMVSHHETFVRVDCDRCGLIEIGLGWLRLRCALSVFDWSCLIDGNSKNMKCETVFLVLFCLFELNLTKRMENYFCSKIIEWTSLAVNA